MVRVADVAVDFRATKGYSMMEVLVQNMATRLFTLQHSKEKNKKKVHTECEEILKTIDRQRARLNGKLDLLERKTLATMKQTRQTLDETLQVEADSCKHFYNTLKKLMIDLTDRRNHSSDYLAFVNYQKCRQMLLISQGLVSGQTNQPTTIEFHQDKGIEYTLAHFESFGLISTSIPTPSPIYNVVSFEEKSIRCADDGNKFSVNGMGQLPNGHVLVADSGNQRLKLFDAGLQSILDKLEINGLFRKLLVLSSSEAAIVVNGKACSEIYIVGINEEKLKVKKKIKLKDACSGLAFSDGHFYVGEGRGISLYSKSGKFVKSLWKDECESGHAIAVSGDGENVFVLCKKQTSLLTLDKHGNQLNCLADCNLFCTLDIDVSPFGNVFVCELVSSQVVQTDDAGKEILSTISTEYGLKDLRCVFFSSISSELYVGQESDVVFVFKMKL